MLKNHICIGDENKKTASIYLWFPRKMNLIIFYFHTLLNLEILMNKKHINTRI